MLKVNSDFEMNKASLSVFRAGIESGLTNRMLVARALFVINITKLGTQYVFKARLINLEESYEEYEMEKINL